MIPASSSAISVYVVAGILFDSQGRVLVAKRHSRAHQGGLWEFPGGKVEDGESPRRALVRELREELDIEVVEMSPFMQVPFQYPDRFVLLDFWHVAQWSGQAVGRESQEVAWRRLESLSPKHFPPADEPVLVALQGLASSRGLTGR